MQDLANKTKDGDCSILVSTMSDFFVSVSEHLPRLNTNHKVFTVNEELPDQYMISVVTTTMRRCTPYGMGNGQCKTIANKN